MPRSVGRFHGGTAADRGRRSAVARSAEPGTALPSHTDRQDALLEQFAFCPVRCLGSVFRNRAGLLGEGQIRIARLVGCLHGSVTRQSGRNSKLLLGPVNVRQTVAGWWLDQPPQPHGRTKNVFRIAWLVAPGATPER